MEEAGGTTLNDIGIADSDGVRSSSLTQVTGVFDGTYATQGDGSNYCTIPWDEKFRNNFTFRLRIKFTSTDIATPGGAFLGIWDHPNNKRMFTLEVSNAVVLRILYTVDGTTVTSVVVVFLLLQTPGMKYK
jgi:hypothetical protein